jgi:hypothetical protein
MSKDATIESSNGTFIAIGVVMLAAVLYFVALPELFAGRYDRAQAEGSALATTTGIKSLFQKASTTPTLDRADYDRRMLVLANYPKPASTTAATTTRHTWPAQTPYPNTGAILPFHRVVAYYGNFYSKGMGVLGEYPTDVVIQKLQAEVARWQAADPTTPVIPAIQYIAVTAQGSPGADGKYRLRMPETQIRKAIDLARQVHGIAIIDVQVGDSNLQAELPPLAKYLTEPDVHLAVDPEFAMHNQKPGTVIGTMSSADINYAITFLDQIATENHLPPKILVVHRFTDQMVTGATNIKPTANVQVVMDMDGWGFGAKKLNTYQRVIQPYPVQFTGFKLFYKNDLKPPSTRLLTPEEVLSVQPRPIYIQYQ